MLHSVFHAAVFMHVLLLHLTSVALSRRAAAAAAAQTPYVYANIISTMKMVIAQAAVFGYEEEIKVTHAAFVTAL
jgi:hypothetical protein